MLSAWNQVVAVSVYSMHTFFLFALCIRTSFSDISVFFRKETRFRFDREASIQPMIVQSLTKCAVQCACITKCVSFFYNHVDALCQLEGKIYMSFDENNNDPWIYYEMRMTNVAAFKPVAMSSEHNPPNHSPHYAVDGQVKNTIDGEQCAHTLNDPNPWLTIDLENTFDVHYVTLFNRIETLGERLRDISVYLGDDHMNGPFPVTCGNFDGPGENAEVVHIVCDKPAHGRFVKIQMNNFQRDSFLTLCEVRVLV